MLIEENRRKYLNNPLFINKPKTPNIKASNTKAQPNAINGWTVLRKS